MMSHERKNIAIIGANGAIGRAFVQLLSARYPDAQIHACAREPLADAPANVTAHVMDYDDEASIAQTVAAIVAQAPRDLVLVTTGILHDGELLPEKALRDISAEKLQTLFTANTVTPALMAKHFLPHLHKDQRAVFAALSARVGSISDNHLGGWYSYRASKAALNMIIKNAAIETARRYKQAIIVGLHPGTVDSPLSKPFQAHVPEGKLFTPADSAEKLLLVLEQLEPADSGKCFAWDGEEVEP